MHACRSTLEDPTGTPSGSDGGTSSATSGPTGGTSSGGSPGSGGTGGSAPSDACDEVDDCVAVVDTGAACYSPGCAGPFAVSREALAADPCLVEYDGGDEARPPSCQAQGSGDIACPALCAAPPSCIELDCASGHCSLQAFFDPSQCGSGQGGANGSGGAPAEDCVELNRDRQEALARARTCNLDSGEPQCSTGSTVADECGCPIPVNAVNASGVEAAEEAREAWSGAGCAPPGPCLAACLVGASASCTLDALSRPVCAYD